MTGRLTGERVALLPVRAEHVPALRRILHTPEVRARWGDADDGSVCGLVQYGEEDDPAYRHASIDIFLDPAVQGRGLGRDAVRTIARHLLGDLGHHRLVIDPAADNEAAIRCYAAVGFRPVGVLRQYERDIDGTGWHDGLLMDLLRDELT
jgi:aminoglycoside 6'-N-acetyltransferase